MDDPQNIPLKNGEENNDEDDIIKRLNFLYGDGFIHQSEYEEASSKLNGILKSISFEQFYRRHCVYNVILLYIISFECIFILCLYLYNKMTIVKLWALAF